MLAKVIDVRLEPGHAEAFMASQNIWHRECLPAPGYLGEISSQPATDVVIVITLWQSLDLYTQWMREDHDRIAALTDSDRHYRTIDITLLAGSQEGS